MQELNRLELLIGKENVEILKNLKVAVVGLGGVGGYAVEALARSGIGTIFLIDADVIETTNLNRQLIALQSTIGLSKVEAWKERILQINPSCNVIMNNIFLKRENIEKVLPTSLDYIIDACDTIQTKKDIISFSIIHKIKFISSMGTGNKLDPSKLKIMDLRKTSYDPIAKILRKFVKDEKITMKIPVVCSEEVPKKVRGVISSNAFVPATAGLLCASYVIRDGIGVL